MIWQVLKLANNLSPTKLMAARLIDDTTAVKSYNAKILQNMQTLFAKRKIDRYEYGHLVNILTCNELKIEKMIEKINHIIDGTEQRSSSIDIKI